MKKSLLAVAAMGAFASAAQAQSSVTVYGILDVGFAGTTSRSTTAPSAPNTIANFATQPVIRTNTTGFSGAGSESTSRLGFRGTEDLGGGTSAFFTAEFALNPTDQNLSGNANGGLFNRQTFVGLKKNGLGSTATNYRTTGLDIGAKAAFAGLELVGYYYDGEGLDSTGVVDQGFFNGNGVKSKDSGGYVQATFVVPGVGTKLGASWGKSMSKSADGTTFDYENESWIVGAYHPLTKSLNLVAEYINNEKTNSKVTANTTKKTETDGINLGAIIFF
jgi:predicted porin